MGEGVLISCGGSEKKRKINKRPFPFIRHQRVNGPFSLKLDTISIPWVNPWDFFF